MGKPQSRIVSAFAVAAAAVLLLGGCSSNKKSSSGSGSGTKTAAVTTVTATETEFVISMSQTTLKPGAYTFKVSNQGKFPHNLTIEGPGVDKAASPTLKAGESGDLKVTLKAGQYEFWCSVDSHKSKGMDMKITVA